MLKVRTADVLPRYRLALEFSDGTSGIADLSKHVEEAPFRPLRDEQTFMTAVVEHGAVEWVDAEVGIATEALYALAHRLQRPRTLEQALSNELEVSLRELRRIVGKTQGQAADEMGITQGTVSQFEGSSDHKVSAVRRFVESLGGKLEVVAIVGSKRLTLNGI